MAYLPLRLDEDFPDFVVTSAYRDTSASHASGNAIDIALVWPGTDAEKVKKKKSLYWFYYFHSALKLWGAQKAGTVNLNWPLGCLHMHIFYHTGQSRCGVEYNLKNAAGKCAPKFPAYVVNRTDYLDAMKLRDYVVYTLANKDGRNFKFSQKEYGYYLNSWENEWRRLKDPFMSTRRIYVDPNGLIEDSKLQAILDGCFAEGWTDQASEHLAQISGWDSAAHAGADIRATVQLWGAFGVIGALWWFSRDGRDRAAPQLELKNTFSRSPGARKK